MFELGFELAVRRGAMRKIAASILILVFAVLSAKRSLITGAATTANKRKSLQ